MEEGENGNDKRLTLGNALDSLLRVLSTASGVLLVFILLSITYEVVLRYYFAQSLVWVTPFAEYSLVLLAFLAAPLILRRDGHVSLGVVVDQLNRRIRLWLELVTSIVGGAACAIITIAGVYTTCDFIARNVRTSEAVDIPEGLFVAVIPLSSFLMFIEFLRIVYRKNAELHNNQMS